MNERFFLFTWLFSNIKSSSKRLLKKSYSNEKSFKKKAIPPEASVDHMNMTRKNKYISTWRQ